MNLGAENRKKTIAAGGLGMVAILCLGYLLYTVFGGDSATPPPSVAPVTQSAPKGGGLNAAVAANAADTSAGGTSGTAAASAGSTGEGHELLTPSGNSAGVAQHIANSSASLDPSLDEVAMLRTESLVYSGTGRNIFSAIYTPPPPAAPIHPPVAPPRPCPPNCPPPPQPYVKPPPPTCPPSCPPINIKFFGTETMGSGVRMAFLLQGDDVFLAAAGDIVARSYKIVSISTSSVQVEDLVNKNTQTLPLQSN